MIRIDPRPGGRKIAADPDQVELRATVVVEFSARSSHTNGENATITYAVNEGSGVLIANDGERSTRIEVPRFVDGGATRIQQVLVLTAAPDQKPCGRLPIRVSVRPAGGTQAHDQGQTHVDIICT